MNDKQLSDQILARARQEVATRRAADLARRWGGRWFWLLPALAFSVVLALTLVTLLVVVGMSEIHGRITNARQLVTPGALSLLVAFAVLGLSAVIRWPMNGS